MNNVLKINFYGKKCVFSSANHVWNNAIYDKFSNFASFETERLSTGRCEIYFTNDLAPTFKGERIASSVKRNASQLRIEHQYLGSTTFIDISYTDSHSPHKISIHFLPSFVFSILNLVSRNLLLKQLYQTIIKLYIEQTFYWMIAKDANLECLHASAVEKDGAVEIFAGMNGVGKTRLALSKVFKEDYSLFSDNYILVGKDVAYFSPDSVRIDLKTSTELEVPIQKDFGFGKYFVTLNRSNYYDKRIAQHSSISLISLSDDAHKKVKQSSAHLWEKIIKQQIAHQEHPRVCMASLFDLESPLTVDFVPTTNYFLLHIKNDEKT